MLLAQSCPTLCDTMDCSPPGSSVHRILQARILEWAAIPFSMESAWPRNWILVSWIAGRFFTIWATREILSEAWVISFIYLLTYFFAHLWVSFTHGNERYFRHAMLSSQCLMLGRHRGSKWLCLVHTSRWRVSSHCCMVYKSVCAWSPWLPLHLYCSLLSQHLILSPAHGCSQARACRRIWSFKR